MQIQVRLFAILKDRAGTGEVTLSLRDGATARDAAEALAEQKPLRDLLPRVAYAVNRSYVSPETILHDGDELALIPPVNGG